MTTGPRIITSLRTWRVRPIALVMLVALALVAYTITIVGFQPSWDLPSTHSALRLTFRGNLQQQTTNSPPSSSVTVRIVRVAALAKLATPSDAEKKRKQREKLRKQCFRERDYGIIPLLRKDKRLLCTDATPVDSKLGNLSNYTIYDSGSALMHGTEVTNLWVDLRNVEITRPIQNRSQDGHLHDPRFKYSSVHAYCVCNTTQNHDTKDTMPVWQYVLGEHPPGDEPFQVCRAFTNSQERDVLQSGIAVDPWNTTLVQLHNSSQAGAADFEPPDPQGWPYPVHYIKQNAIIVGRRDDHNPFFQIAMALNAWLLIKVVGWTPETTQLVYFDDALPAPTDELQQRMIAPVHPVIHGRELMGSVVHFDQALIAPSEYFGPMMRHLDDKEPCQRNQLIQNFRDLALGKFGVEPIKRDPATCTITVISRRPLYGRVLQRKWLNEDAIVDRMRLNYVQNSSFYQHGTCRIQSIDFVGLSLEDQMRIVIESDVILGMHGAGMANLIWARAATVVIEIFPYYRKRYGYRNLCQFLGCKYYEFRNGTDTGEGNNWSDKLISYADWFAFVDPIMQDTIRLLEAYVTETRRRDQEGRTKQ